VAAKSIFRISITIILTLVLAGIIFYPKLKPMFSSGKGDSPQAGMRSMGGSQPLFASGYVLVPTKMNEMIYSTASLLPDEEVDLAFETSGKVVGLYFEEGPRVKKENCWPKLTTGHCRHN
jgi:membrane fusion protein, multidrug efflux system